MGSLPRRLGNNASRLTKNGIVANLLNSTASMNLVAAVVEHQHQHTSHSVYYWETAAYQMIGQIVRNFLVLVYCAPLSSCSHSVSLSKRPWSYSMPANGTPFSTCKKKNVIYSTHTHRDR